MLGCFIGRAPGVTLTTVGIYGAVVEVASGLRKVNQAFNPIFAPLIAGMTANGDQEHAAATFSRVAQWMLWILLPLFAVMALAGPVILSIYGAAFRQGALWLDIVALACGTNCFVGLAETVIMVQRPRINVFNSAVTCVVAFVANLWLINSLGVTGAAFGILVALRPARRSAPSRLATCFRLGAAMEQHRAAVDRGRSSPPCQRSFAACCLTGFRVRFFPPRCFFWSSASNGGSTSGARGAELMKRIFLTGASSGHRPGHCKSARANGHEVWGTARDSQRIPALPGMHRHRARSGRSRFVRRKISHRLARSGAFRRRDQQRRERLLRSRGGAFA